ncbi:MAG: hypothetical protein J6Z22_11050 [Lachnospiraceae bacterium]|nr:hypothetical protein [Lachnospiraceae bacterium]
MKNEELMNAIGNIDDDMLKELDGLRGGHDAVKESNDLGEAGGEENMAAFGKKGGAASSFAWRKWLAPLAACLLLMIGGLTAYAMIHSGGFLSIRQRGTSEKNLQSYHLTLTDAVKIPRKEIKGEIQNLEDLFKEDYKGFIVPLDRSVGSHTDEFDTLEEAESFVGYENLHLIHMIDQPDSIMIQTFGEPFLTNSEDQEEREKTEWYQRWKEMMDSDDDFGFVIDERNEGKFDNIEMLYQTQQCPMGLTGKDFYAALTMIWISARYITDDSHLMYQTNAILFTDHYADEIGVRGATVGDISYNDKCRVVNGREFIVLDSEGFQSGMVDRSVFWQEGNVLYQFSCHYMPNQKERVDELTEEWMNGFK